MTGPHTPDRDELLDRLIVLNRALGRAGIQPRITASEASLMDIDGLRSAVATTADRLATATAKLRGIP
jgi:hypothetical protein